MPTPQPRRWCLQQQTDRTSGASGCRYWRTCASSGSKEGPSPSCRLPLCLYPTLDYCPTQDPCICMTALSPHLSHWCRLDRTEASSSWSPPPSLSSLPRSDEREALIDQIAVVAESKYHQTTFKSYNGYFDNYFMTLNEQTNQMFSRSTFLCSLGGVDRILRGQYRISFLNAVLSTSLKTILQLSKKQVHSWTELRGKYRALSSPPVEWGLCSIWKTLFFSLINISLSLGFVFLFKFFCHCLVRVRKRWFVFQYTLNNSSTFNCSSPLSSDAVCLVLVKVCHHMTVIDTLNSLIWNMGE